MGSLKTNKQVAFYSIPFSQVYKVTEGQFLAQPFETIQRTMEITMVSLQLGLVLSLGFEKPRSFKGVISNGCRLPH